MLYLDAPIGPIGGLMIYRDHADPNLFYYVPERPRLARNDGVPEFVFLKYRRDITDNAAFDPNTKQELGGGFLAFTVDLGVDDDQLTKIKGELGPFAEGEVKLTPIQFRKGSVRLSITKDIADTPQAKPDEPHGMTFFEDVYGATTPSLFGFNRATFALVLTEEAATLFEAALRSGVSPIGVIYDLEFLGLRPAFDVKITAEYQRIYSDLELEFGARGQIYAVALGLDIDAAFQKLRDSGAIKVEVLSFTDDENLRKQADAAFDWFKTDLLKDFFKSSLEPPSFMRPSAGGGGLLGQLQSLLGGLGTSGSGSPQPQLGQPTNSAPTPAPPPANQASNVATTPQTQGTAPAAGGGGAKGSTSLAPFQVAFSLKYVQQEELKTRTFEYSEQAAVAREAAPQGLFSTVIQGLDLRTAIKEISLDDDFFTRLVATVSVGTDLNASGVAALAVNLEYPGDRPANAPPKTVDGFLFKPDSLTPQTFNSWLDDKKDLTYRYQMTVDFKPDSPWHGKDAKVTSDWQVTRSRQLVIDPLDVVGLLDVEMSLGSVDATQISQVQVDLSYEDTANNFDAQQTIVLKPGAGGIGSAHWKLRLSNPNQRQYRYLLTYFMQDNVHYQTDWQTTEDPSLVVNDPFQSVLRLRLVPVLDAASLIEADVNVKYSEPSGYSRQYPIVFSGPTLTSQALAIPTLTKTPTGYTYDITVINQDGSTKAVGPTTVTPDTQVVVVSDGAGATHRIRVRLPSPSLGPGLAAIKVDLTGPGAPPDTAEALFTPSQLADQTVALVQADTSTPFVYQYAVTGYTTQGLPVHGDSGQSSSPNLIVRLPTP